MVIYVDIDNTICVTEGSAYTKSKPIQLAIDRINELYSNGHTIIYWTARGSVTGINWTELTKAQFEEWGVLYTELKFGKPAYDLFIDDKNINANTWHKSLSIDTKC